MVLRVVEVALPHGALQKAAGQDYPVPGEALVQGEGGRVNSKNQVELTIIREHNNRHRQSSNKSSVQHMK